MATDTTHGIAVALTGDSRSHIMQTAGRVGDLATAAAFGVAHQAIAGTGIIPPISGCSGVLVVVAGDVRTVVGSDAASSRCINIPDRAEAGVFIGVVMTGRRAGLDVTKCTDLFLLSAGVDVGKQRCDITIAEVLADGQHVFVVTTDFIIGGWDAAATAKGPVLASTLVAVATVTACQERFWC